MEDINDKIRRNTTDIDRLAVRSAFTPFYRASQIIPIPQVSEGEGGRLGEQEIATTGTGESEVDLHLKYLSATAVVAERVYGARVLGKALTQEEENIISTARAVRLLMDSAFGAKADVRFEPATLMKRYVELVDQLRALSSDA